MVDIASETGAVNWVHELRRNKKEREQNQRRGGGGIRAGEGKRSKNDVTTGQNNQNTYHKNSSLPEYGLPSPFQSRFTCRKRVIRDESCGCLSCWWEWFMNCICGLWRFLSSYLIFFTTMGIFTSATMYWVEELFRFPSCGGWCFPADESMFMCFWFTIALLIAGLLDYFCGCSYETEVKCPFRYVKDFLFGRSSFSSVSSDRRLGLSSNDPNPRNKNEEQRRTISKNSFLTKENKRGFLEYKSGSSNLHSFSQGSWSFYLILILSGLNLGSVVLFLLCRLIAGTQYGFIIFMIGTAVSGLGHLLMLQDYVLNRVCRNTN